MAAKKAKAQAKPGRGSIARKTKETDIAVSLALGAGESIEDAMGLASAAAGVVVSKRGTSTVSPAELAAALDDA